MDRDKAGGYEDLTFRDGRARTEAGVVAGPEIRAR